MGLLDDAIREHLDLKRRRGADPEEVASAEQEALGPPGRPTPLEDAASASAAELEPDEVAAAPDEPFDVFADEEIEADEVPSEDRLEAEPATELYDASAESATADEEDELLVEEEDDEDLEFDLPERGADGTAEQPVIEDEAAAPEPPVAEEDEASDTPETGAEGEGDDVLEETPEFLQETPEHDRLWFEQKPPRDFDFGGS